MDLAQAEKEVIAALEQWGLWDKGWRFKFDRAVKRAGSTNWLSDGQPGYITLSRALTERETEEEVRDTILHEVAHALAGPDTGHNAVWRQWCRRVGARPNRCSPSSAGPIPLRWEGTCPNGHVYYRQRRPPERMGSCAKCSPVFNPAYKFSWRDTKA